MQQTCLDFTNCTGICDDKTMKKRKPQRIFGERETEFLINETVG